MFAMPPPPYISNPLLYSKCSSLSVEGGGQTSSLFNISDQSFLKSLKNLSCSVLLLIVVIGNLRHIKHKSITEFERTSGVLPGPSNKMDNGATDDVPSQYKEKKWGKTEDGEYIIDGFTFRGKKPFAKVVVGLRELFKKGIEREIDEYEDISKVKALDVREKGNGLEMDIEITEKDGRGVAVLKLYGPNSRKENVVMVTKCKQSDSKFVTILAEKFIKPWMKKKLNNEPMDISKLKKSVSAKGKRIAVYTCPYCDVTSHSSPGLKGHITKKHTEFKKNKEKTVHNKIHTLKETVSKNEVLDVVDFLLSEVIEISDDEDSHVKAKSLEESCNVPEVNKGKKYINKCDRCEFRVEDTKKYAVLQNLSKHKKSNCENRGNCEQCDFKSKDRLQLKRHMRDEHEQSTASTSPPPKRKRKTPVKGVDSVEDMEIEEEDLKDLSFKLEEMDIDEDDKSLEELLVERSDMMDKKIVEKEKRLEETDKTFERKKHEIEERKRIEITRKTKLNEKEKKKQKQSSKKMKRKSKSISKNIEQVLKKTKYSVSNIRDIPENCRHLFKIGDVMYLVPGDGSCGPSCASAHLFKDEVFGPKLRRKMNYFQATHWNNRYQYLTQCSQNHPFVRQLKGKKVRFTDPEELIEFLKHSEEAAYMWTDSEDLAIIADMYQMKIKVVTTKGETDKSPTVNWIHPDPELKEFAELKDIEIDDLVLLHQNDTHFNLIVSKESDLAMYGSLSYRFNVGPIMEDLNKPEEDVEKDSNDDIENASEESTLVNIKKQLKECQKVKQMIESEYYKCQKELNSKTEECEKLKIEVKDLKQIIELEEKTGEKSETEKEAEAETNDNENPWIIKDKSKTAGNRNKRAAYDNREPTVSSDEQFNCNDCDFQGTTGMQLKKHFMLKHTVKSDGPIKCRVCGEGFDVKWKLMNHRKDQHMASVGHCRNYNERKCYYSATMCWWKHEDNQTGSGDNINCYVCNESFGTKMELMIHRKKEHGSIVRQCSEFIQNNCRFQE